MSVSALKEMFGMVDGGATNMLQDADELACGMKLEVARLDEGAVPRYQVRRY